MSKSNGNTEPKVGPNEFEDVTPKIQPASRKGQPIKRVSINDDELRYLYEVQKLSSIQLAKRFNCSKATILIRLKKLKIKMREPGVPEVEISEKELRNLYEIQNLSAGKIAKIYHCGRTTIFRKLEEYKIETRDLSDSHIIYQRASFSGDVVERAYMLGFTIGDLRVRKSNKNGNTIQVDCSSNKKEQVDVFSEIFHKYGHIYISEPTAKGIVSFSVNVDLSFSFLLNPGNKLDASFNDDEQFLAFFGGFIDAEGSFFIDSKGQHVFSLTQYDEDILRKIQNKMFSYNLRFSITIARKKYSYKQKNSQNVLKTYTQKDFMKVLRLNKRAELLVFCNLIEKYLKHANRLRQLQTIRNYIFSKMENKKE